MISVLILMSRLNGKQLQLLHALYDTRKRRHVSTTILVTFKRSRAKEV